MKKSIALLSLLLISACASNKEENVVSTVHQSNQNQIEKPAEQQPDTEQQPDRYKVIKDFNEFTKNNPIYFKFDSVKIVNDDIANKYAKLARELDEDTTLTIEGYCDNRGSDNYNDALGQRRAEAVKNKIGKSDAKVVSYGKRKFKNYSKDFEENQQANRKVVVIAK